MTRFNLLFALFLAVFCVVEINAQRRCPPNEEWRSCGTACPPTCRNPYARACTMQCVAGCFCKPGWLRSRQGNCVKKCRTRD
ncbi:chymotrypsin inhibitor [Fopius arisanus]|nr:PREDICTED: chymotrypsin inhibitor [Fopius arisanus]